MLQSKSNYERQNNLELNKVVAVKFKGNRKEYFLNAKKLIFKNNDYVVVELLSGFDIGKIDLVETIVNSQHKIKSLQSDPVLQIVRIANRNDIENFERIKKREIEALPKARLIAKNLGLKMKITDVEYRSDFNFATFFYTADNRVDFRELILFFAKEFTIKIIMRQISNHDEMRRLGAFGYCGREYCSSSWKSSINANEFQCCMSENYKKVQICKNPIKSKKKQNNYSAIFEDDITRFD